MMKTRLQNMQPDKNGVMPYAGVADCATKILKNEGVFRCAAASQAMHGHLSHTLAYPSHLQAR